MAKAKPAKKKSTIKVKQEVVYPDVQALLKTGSDALTVEEAKGLLGWTTEDDLAAETPEGETAPKFAQGEYNFRDVDGNKVKLANNVANRPFRMSLAKRYANEMLRGKWQLNGESIVIGRFGNVQSGQHRLIGLVLAEQLRKKDKTHWEQYVKHPMKLDCVVVVGISEDDSVANTHDLGQNRTLADVLFRGQHFAATDEKTSKKLSRTLAIAARLVWLRHGGKTVSDAPHFPHSEALDFLEMHPKLADAVDFVIGENKEGEGAISTYLSLGYAAALLYLTGTSGTDPEGYRAGTDDLDLGLWEKAEEFWVSFANGGQHKLATYLQSLDHSGAMGRDEVIGTIIKGINLYMDGKEIGSVKDIKMKKVKDKDTGKLVLGETPRLGGLDTEPEIIPDEEPEEAEVEAPPAKGSGKAEVLGQTHGSKSRGGWKAGDTAWVKDPDDAHWFGTVMSVDAKTKTAVLEAEEGGEYQVPLTVLQIKEPAGAVAAV